MFNRGIFNFWMYYTMDYLDYQLAERNADDAKYDEELARHADRFDYLIPEHLKGQIDVRQMIVDNSEWTCGEIHYDSVYVESLIEEEIYLKENE